MIRTAIYVSAELTDQPFFSSALKMLGWMLVPCAQLDHALTRMRKEPADALILHAPLPGIELTQALVDRIQRASQAKIVVLGVDDLRDNRNQRVIPDPVTAAELATSLTSLCPTESSVLLENLLRSEAFDLFTQSAVAYLLSRTSALQLQPGEQLFSEGDVGNSMFFILTGVIGLRLTTMELPSLTTGALFGEMSMLQGSPRSATAYALEPTVLLEVPAEVVEDADSDFRAVLFELISRTLMERLQHSNQFVSSIEEAEVVDLAEGVVEAIEDAVAVEAVEAGEADVVVAEPVG
jgi:CRP-like cAMP-binding protein